MPHVRDVRGAVTTTKSQRYSSRQSKIGQQSAQRHYGGPAESDQPVAADVTGTATALILRTRCPR
jgi:hypothetical protein